MNSGPEIPDFEDRLAEANEKIYQSPTEARGLLNSLLESVPETQVELRARVTERLSIVERILGNFDLATRLGATAVAGYETSQNQVGVSRAWVSLGNIHWSRGNLREALDFYRKAYTQRAKLSDHSATAGALASMANIHAELGQFDDARDEYEEVLTLAHRANNKRIIARTENNLSECLLMMGHPGTALNHARSALELCRKLGDRSEEPNVLINLGQILGKLRFSQEAGDRLAEAVQTSAAIGDRRAHAESLSLWAVQLRAQRAPSGEETPDDLEDQAYTEATEIGAFGLQSTICDRAIKAAETAGNSARLRKYQKRKSSIPPA